MARINIEDCWWTDPRRSALIRMLGGEEVADGVAVRAWRLGQEFWKHNRALVPIALFKALNGAEALIEAGLADVRESFVYVRGSSAYLDWVFERAEIGRANGAKGGKASAEARRKKYGSAVPLGAKNSEATPNQTRNKASVETPNDRSTPNPSVSGSISVSISDSSSESKIQDFASGPSAPDASPKNLPVVVAPEKPRKAKSEPTTRATWEAYASAYEARYHADPVRNQTVNGQLAHFVKRLGEEEAPQVAAFYLTHNASFYVGAMHPVSLMLRDAEKLRTEWATNRRTTQVEAKHADRRQHTMNVFGPLLEEARRREEGTRDDET